MIYFDSDMSKSTNTVVYIDWKKVIYIYACAKCRTHCILPMETSVTFTGAYANEIIPSIHRSFVYRAKEGGNVRILYRSLFVGFVFFLSVFSCFFFGIVLLCFFFIFCLFFALLCFILLCFVLSCFVLPAVFSVIWLKKHLWYSNFP